MEIQIVHTQFAIVGFNISISRNAMTVIYICVTGQNLLFWMHIERQNLWTVIWVLKDRVG